jgi:hypothetical protein
MVKRVKGRVITTYIQKSGAATRWVLEDDGEEEEMVWVWTRLEEKIVYLRGKHVIFGGAAEWEYIKGKNKREIEYKGRDEQGIVEEGQEITEKWV